MLFPPDLVIGDAFPRATALMLRRGGPFLKNHNGDPGMQKANGHLISLSY